MTSLVKIQQVKKYFGHKQALGGLSLQLEKGEQYAVCGESGSGKSTLLYLMGGLDRPSSGEIIINGQNLCSMNDERLALHRNRFVGFVFQFHFLLSSMNCLDNILLPGRIAGMKRDPLQKTAEEMADELGIHQCLKKYPYELSGGEQQRINIIRAVSLKPPLLLCDEPCGNLDSMNSKKVLILLKRLAREQSSTLVVVTHNEQIAVDFPFRFLLKDGRLVDSSR